MGGPAFRLRVLLKRWVKISLDIRGSSLLGTIITSLVLLMLSTSTVHRAQAPTPQTYGNGSEPPRSITLEDGSVSILDASTEIRTEFDAERRAIELLRGQALFKVTHNIHRPFEVAAGRITVRAVGTEFSVRRQSHGRSGEEQVTVLVSEGRVRITSSGSEPTELVAGQMAVSNPGGDLSVIPHPVPPVDQAIGWTKGRLYFAAGETLAEAVSLFNQYGAAEFEITDRSITERRVGGSVRINEPQDFLDMLIQIRIESVDAGYTPAGVKRFLVRAKKTRSH